MRLLVIVPYILAALFLFWLSGQTFAADNDWRFEEQQRQLRILQQQQEEHQRQLRRHHRQEQLHYLQDLLHFTYPHHNPHHNFYHHD